MIDYDCEPLSSSSSLYLCLIQEGVDNMENYSPRCMGCWVKFNPRNKKQNKNTRTVLVQPGMKILSDYVGNFGATD